MRWTDAYRSLLEKELRAEIGAVVKREFDEANRREIQAWLDRGKKDEKGKDCSSPLARKVTNSLVTNVVLALAGYCLLDARTQQPSWLGDDAPFPATEILPTKNSLVHLPTLEDDDDATRRPTPAFFCPYALSYDFDAFAPEPVHWLTFLGARPLTPSGRIRNQVWPDDQQAIGTLQEWFGYHLTPDTRKQKVGALIGPRRSGKGTIARVLRELNGPENVAGPTLSSLASNFGLAPLIGKPCAIISDARLSGRSDQAAIVERLLSISGEDTLTIDRKHLPAWSGKLPTRITILSNELPRLSDSSGALAGRLVILRLTRSFFGDEDETLTDLFLTELPGILLWAIEGWNRLRRRGRFIQPDSGKEMIEALEDLSSPVGAFVRERCVVRPGCEVAIEFLFSAWKTWCTEKGRDNVGTEQEFGRNLRAVIPSLTTPNRRQDDGRRRRFYEGIDLELPAAF